MLSSIRNVMLIKMRKLTMFITAVCVLFLIKLRWPKNKSLYDTVASSLYTKIAQNICGQDGTFFSSLWLASKLSTTMKYHCQVTFNVPSISTTEHAVNQKVI